MTTERTERTIHQAECLRCGHLWFPYSLEKPVRCSKCKTPYWDRPHKNKRKKVYGPMVAVIDEGTTCTVYEGLTREC